MSKIERLRQDLARLEAEITEISNLGCIPYPAPFVLDTFVRGQQTYYRQRQRRPDGKPGKPTYISQPTYAQLAIELEHGRQLHRLQKQVDRLHHQLDAAHQTIATLGGKVQKPLVHHSSDSNEWYTPAAIVALAREVMGGIDLDPASNPTAQAWIQAKQWYGQEHDGFTQAWAGRVWLNPPYGQTSKQNGNYGASAWMLKAIAEYDHGKVEQAILLVKGDSLGIRTLRKRFPFCEPEKRIDFIRPDGEPSDKQPGTSRLFYLGDKVVEFRTIFARLGDIVECAR